MKRTTAALAAAVLAGMLSITAAHAQPTEAPSTVGATYRAASATEVLKPGEKVANLFKLNMETPYVLQKLTARTYWYQSGFYATIFYVGDQGVLLFDPLEDRAEPLLKAIRSVTDKPVSTIVYSHDHADHIGGTPDFLKAVAGQKQRPRIIASAATVEKMKLLGSRLPKADQSIAWPKGSFTFETLKVELHGFKHAAHTDDHAAWLLVGERVLHAEPPRLSRRPLGLS